MILSTGGHNFHVQSATQVARLVETYGNRQPSRIGDTFEFEQAHLILEPGEIMYRRGMSGKLGPVEVFQFWSGYFDERHIKLAVPNLQYPYGIANAYGQKVAQQLPKVVQQLRDTNDSRRALLFIGKPEDGQEVERPCVTLMQFTIRNGYLNTYVYVRSWDAISGMPYDLILFQGVTQIMASLVDAKPGKVSAFTPSLHVYEHALDRAGDSLVKFNHVNFAPFAGMPLEMVRTTCHDLLNDFAEGRGLRGYDYELV